MAQYVEILYFIFSNVDLQNQLHIIASFSYFPSNKNHCLILLTTEPKIHTEF